MIDIYTKGTKWSRLSNFGETHFTWQGATWPTVEHAFQAAKFWWTDPEYSTKIRNSSTPQQAKRMGKSRSHPIDPDWDRVRLDMMEEILRHRFDQSQPCRLLLLDTRSEPIEERSPFDNFWGTSKRGNGHNHIGKLLMKIREDLK